MALFRAVAHCPTAMILELRTFGTFFFKVASTKWRGCRDLGLGPLKSMLLSERCKSLTSIMRLKQQEHEVEICVLLVCFQKTQLYYARDWMMIFFFFIP